MCFQDLTHNPVSSNKSSMMNLWLEKPCQTKPEHFFGLLIILALPSEIEPSQRSQSILIHLGRSQIRVQLPLASRKYDKVGMNLFTVMENFRREIMTMHVFVQEK